MEIGLLLIKLKRMVLSTSNLLETYVVPLDSIQNVFDRPTDYKMTEKYVMEIVLSNDINYLFKAQSQLELNSW